MKGGRGAKMRDCELVVTCPYYNDRMYGMADIDKVRYCQGSYHWCGRYLTFKAGQHESRRMAGAEHRE